MLCQGDAFIAELEAEKASEISKASRKKNKKKKKGAPDPQLVRTQDLRTLMLGLFLSLLNFTSVELMGGRRV